MGQNQNDNRYQRQARTHNKALPIVKQEDVKYKSELADENDVEAVERAEAADERQEQK